MSFVENPIALRIREEYDKGKRSEQNASPDPTLSPLFEDTARYIASPTTYQDPPAESFRPSVEVMSYLDMLDRRMAVDPRTKPTEPGRFLLKKIIAPKSSELNLVREQKIPGGPRIVRITRTNYTTENNRKINMLILNFELRSTGEFEWERWYLPSYAYNAQLHFNLSFDRFHPDFSKVAPAFEVLQHLVAAHVPELIQVNPVP